MPAFILALSCDIIMVECAFSILAFSASFPRASVIFTLYALLTASEFTPLETPSTCKNGPADSHHPL